MKKGRNIATPVILRMPRYYRCVDELYRSNCVRVSSNTIASLLDITASQVRQDFSSFGEFGQQGYGYNVEKLRREIQEILGINKRHSAIIVGCGNLGRALIRNFEFKKCGFTLSAIFDTSKNLVGSTIDAHLVRDSSGLSEYIREVQPTVAVLTVPKDSANQMAQIAAEAGIKGIWNFTGVDLNLKDNSIKIENVILLDSLMTLNYWISEEE